MKILRSVNRRGFSIGSAGYFTILKPNTWFPASRLPGKLTHSSGRPKGAAESSASAIDQQNHAPIPERAIPSSYLKLIARDPSVVRPALIVLAAAAITSILLLWISHPR